MAALSDVKDAEAEWTRRMTGEELQHTLRNAKQVIQSYRPVRQRASEYLDELLREQPAVTGRRDSAANVYEEVDRLREEVRRLTQNLSQTNVQSSRTRINQGVPAEARPQSSAADGPASPVYSEEPQEEDGRMETASVRSIASSRAPEGEGLIRALTQALSSVRRQDKLPVIEPDVFDSSYIGFPGWWASFRVTAEDPSYTDRERLCLLVKYTSGRANAIVKDYQAQIDNREAYQDAKAALFENFGDKIRIAEAYKAKLASWPNIRQGDAAGLRKYADFLSQCQTAMNTVTYRRVLEQPEENAKLASKLPTKTTENWNRKVTDRLYPDDRTVLDDRYGQYPTFSEFIAYVRREARVADGVCMQKGRSSSSTESSETQRKPVRNFDVRTQVQSREPQTPSSSAPQRRTAQEWKQRRLAIQAQENKECVLCKQGHHVGKCQKFKAKSVEERKEFATSKNLCFGCLYSDHRYRFCRVRDASLIGESRPKPQGPALNTTSLTTAAQAQLPARKEDSADEVRSAAPRSGQVFPPAPLEHMTVSMNTNLNSDDISDRMSFVVPLVIFHTGSMTKSYVYALMDTQSEGCFVSEDLARRMELPGIDCKLEIFTMGKPTEVDTRQISGLCVKGIKEDQQFKMPPVYVKEIPASRYQIPRHSDLENWPHLQRMREECLEYQPRWEIEVLIGYNMHWAFVPEKDSIWTGGLGDPFAMKTPLGWVAMGPKVPGPNRRITSMPTSKVVVREEILEDIRRVFDAGFDPSAGDDAKMSQEDLLFLDIMKKGKQRDADGHYSLPLPLRDVEEETPYSLCVASRRLESLRRRLARDPEFKAHYLKFMDDMFRGGYAERVPDNEMAAEAVWYLPHQGVRHPRKPGKIRVVFDGSAKSKGVCLNTLLYPGPDMNNTLLGVLCRFRLNTIGYTCDIEAMFLQVRVQKEHRNLLRFLWFPDGDIEQPPQHYRVTVHLFGATSSPAVATYALRQVADDHEGEYEDEVLDFIRRMFYVDDGLGSTDDPETAVRRILASHELCKKGGFNLHKFACSSPEVMSGIPADLRADNMKQFDLNPSSADQHVTLGMIWCLLEDCWKFVIQQQKREMTRRGLLSTLSSIYDPLGLVSPALLPGRNLLKRLCSAKYHWDSPLPEEVCVEWRAWYDQLSDLEQIKIPRCYRPELTEYHRVEYHLFADASMEGFGACAYIVYRNLSNGQSARSLVLAKSRVHPSRVVSMPRMELQAAVMATKLRGAMLRELPFQSPTIYLWSDSKIVLGYLNNDAKRFQVYVSNRVQYIKDNSQLKEWRYVNTNENPADLASRGVTARELAESDLWWRGPEMMLNPGPVPEPSVVPDNDPEIRARATVLSTMCKPVVQERDQSRWLYTEKLECLSSWNKMVVCLAHWLRFLSQAVRVAKKQPKLSYPPVPDVVERERASAMLTLQAQIDHLPEVYEMVKKGTYPSSSAEVRDRKLAMRGVTNLYRLDLYLDQQGLLRVGGRCRRSCLPNAVKHPVVLPASAPIAIAIVRDYHHAVCHSGISHTLSAIRFGGWWILRCRRLIARVIRECVLCNRVRGPLLHQRMADLPRERLIESPPFTYCGVDLLGPFTIHAGRSEKKRWIALFTWLVSRSVHLEICENLSTDSFLSSYRRFVNRRGLVRLLRSDRGTNVVGTKNELEKRWRELDGPAIARRLASQGCDFEQFQFNVPRAPHMGGVWERLVKAVKNVLRSLLLTHGRRLDDWSLFTFITEAEAVVNSRPLTYVESGDSSQPTPITPARLLTLKENTAPPPPGEYPRSDLYARSRWRRAQYLADQFWSRWRAEYIPQLQKRQKWLSTRANLKEGDIVMLQEEGADRVSWPMGCVIQVRTSQDGLVRSATVKTKHGTYERPVPEWCC